MSDFLKQALADESPVSREVAFGKKTGKVFFRKITAGERALLLKGQKIQANAGKSTFDIDLSDNQRSKHLMVLFSVCNEDGSKFFKDVMQVEKTDAAKVETLYSVAQAYNDETDGEDAGKS